MRAREGGRHRRDCDSEACHPPASFVPHSAVPLERGTDFAKAALVGLTAGLSSLEGGRASLRARSVGGTGESVAQEPAISLNRRFAPPSFFGPPLREDGRACEPGAWAAQASRWPRSLPSPCIVRTSLCRPLERGTDPCAKPASQADERHRRPV